MSSCRDLSSVLMSLHTDDENIIKMLLMLKTNGLLFHMKLLIDREVIHFI